MVVIVLICGCIYGRAQDSEVMAAIVDFTGSGSVEEIDAQQLEILEKLISHPLRINLSTASKLADSGLFTRYQTVSLIDYRTRHGHILSFSELAMIDGFGDAFVRKLIPFISLETDRPPGERDKVRKLFHELEVKGGLLVNNEFKHIYALRYSVDYDDCLRISAACSKSSASARPDAFTGSAMLHLKRYSGKLVLGAFNACFGHGLALSSGMSISGLAKPSSYLKRASSLSSSSSFTGNYSFKGIAAEGIAGIFRMTTLCAITGKTGDIGVLPASNLTLLLPSGQVGVSHYIHFKDLAESLVIPDMKTSLDASFTIRGTDVFAELVYDWVGQTPACVSGAVVPIGEDVSVGTMFRCYPSSFTSTFSGAHRSLTKCTNECSGSLSIEYVSGKWIKINGADGFGASVRRVDGNFCCDAAYLPVSKAEDGTKSYQIKTSAELKVFISDALASKIRLAGRYRTWGMPYRSDLRVDLFYYSSLFDVVLRSEVVRGDGWGILAYAETLFKKKSLKASFRLGGFCVDDWDDRIYAYERDIPGSYNVPAFYGRGVWTSLTFNCKFSKWGTCYMRASMTQYPFMEKKKPGKAELKLMMKIVL